MTDQIMQKLDEMQTRCTAATFDGDWLDLYGPPSQLRAIHAVTESDMPRLIAALKEIAYYASQHPCYCLEKDRPDPEGCYCSGNGHGPTSCADCLTYELNEIITKALGVNDE